ncbi:MAG: cytidine deaminase [Provencibacterium sp.]|nr:cytidine deaminase [Provencibacterium sp.]
MEEQQLIRQAFAARERAYTPYSRFQVGAALLTEAGKVYGGCNIENAAYTPTNCAERTAIFKAVSEGERRFSCIAVVGATEGTPQAQFEACWPCGVCRQVLREFCGPDFRILTFSGANGIETRTLAQLLPDAFGPEMLGDGRKPE